MTFSDPGARLVQAARDLADANGSASFTVAQVAARAGASLKAFYRTFAGKDDLLVALLATESSIGAAVLRDIVAVREGPPLRAYVEGIFELASLPDAHGYARVLVQEHRRLAERRPDDLDAALAPLVELLAEIVGDERDARTVFGLVLSGLHDVSLGRSDPRDTATYLAAFAARGVRSGRTPAHVPAAALEVR
jgi:AcrR family transcriptional regulator